MNNTPPQIPRREWLLAAGLLLLALVPSLAGSVRLGEIATSAPVTADNARFMQVPVPVVLHIVSAIVYAIIGAFQFLPTVRRRYRRWHQFAGRYLLVPAGAVVATTGLWMTAAYQMPPWDGLVLEVTRYAVGLFMLAFLYLGVRAVLRGDTRTHGAWMLRAYAIGMGAGTQVLTSGPFLLLVGEPSVGERAAQMLAGWLINAIVAEWVISRRDRTPQPAPTIRA